MNFSSSRANKDVDLSFLQKKIWKGINRETGTHSSSLPSEGYFTDLFQMKRRVLKVVSLARFRVNTRCFRRFKRTSDRELIPSASQTYLTPDRHRRPSISGGALQFNPFIARDPSPLVKPGKEMSAKWHYNLHDIHITHFFAFAQVPNRRNSPECPSQQPPDCSAPLWRSFSSSSYVSRYKHPLGDHSDVQEIGLDLRPESRQYLVPQV